MCCKKIIVTYFRNIARKKFRMRNIVDPRVFACILNSFFNHFHTNYFFRVAAYKYSYTTRATIKIINNFCPFKFSKFSCYLV